MELISESAGILTLLNGTFEVIYDNFVRFDPDSFSQTKGDMILEVIKARLNEIPEFNNPVLIEHLSELIGCFELLTTDHYYKNVHTLSFEKQCRQLNEEQLATFNFNRILLLAILWEYKNGCAAVPLLSNSIQLKFNRGPGDFIEIVAALLESNSVARVDGKKLTRTELIKQFKQLFFIENPNNMDQLLNSRVNNKKDKTPFLTDLKKNFDVYCSKKEEERKSNQ
jgi:hypothetical protein